MADYSPDVIKESIEALDDDQLLNRMTNGSFSDEARPLAEEELRRRHIAFEIRNEQPTTSPTLGKRWTARTLGVVGLAVAVIVATIFVGILGGSPAGAFALVVLVGLVVGAFIVVKQLILSTVWRARASRRARHVQRKPETLQ